MRRRMDLPVVDLPQPDSADQPQCLAALQVEADVVDRVQHTVTGLEVFFQVTDL